MSNNAPLTPVEALAAWIAGVRAFDKGGGHSATGCITRLDDKGLTFDFAVPNFMARNLIAADPECVALAEEHAAIAMETRRAETGNTDSVAKP